LAQKDDQRAVPQRRQHQIRFLANATSAGDRSVSHASHSGWQFLEVVGVTQPVSMASVLVKPWTSQSQFASKSSSIPQHMPHLRHAWGSLDWTPEARLDHRPASAQIERGPASHPPGDHSPGLRCQRYKKNTRYKLAALSASTGFSNSAETRRNFPVAPASHFGLVSSLPAASREPDASLAPPHATAKFTIRPRLGAFARRRMIRNFSRRSCSLRLWSLFRTVLACCPEPATLSDIMQHVG